jgi:hypothetical protein
MTIILSITFVVLVVGLIGIGLASALYRSNKTLKQTIDFQNRQALTRDNALDYILRYYQLNISNPYITRPGFEDRRCFHCHHPEGFGHHQECPWLHLRPLTAVLYPPPPKPVKTPADDLISSVQV